MGTPTVTRRGALRTLVASGVIIAVGGAALWGVSVLSRPTPHDLIFGGDVMMGRDVETWRGEGADSFGEVAPVFRAAGQVVVNLESPLTQASASVDKEIVLKADPGVATLLSDAGITAALLANNHTFDYGWVGFQDTVSALSEVGIAYTGAGANEIEATTPLHFDVAGEKVSLLNFSKYSSLEVPAATESRWGQAFYGQPRFQQSIRREAETSDLVIVVLHFGREYWLDADDEQREVAQRAIDLGADIVIGHHPHVTQPVERYGDGLIFYSLGNLVFDQETPPRDRSFLVALDVNANHLMFTLYPYTITRGEVQWMEEDAGQAFLSDLAQRSTPGLLQSDRGVGHIILGRSGSLAE